MNRSSADTSSFVRTHIPSVHTLEVLLLLFNRTGHPVTQDDVLAQIKSSSIATAESLRTLASTGVIQRIDSEPDGYVYVPEKNSSHAALVELARLYQERSSSVVRMIHSPPPRN